MIQLHLDLNPQLLLRAHLLPSTANHPQPRNELNKKEKKAMRITAISRPHCKIFFMFPFCNILKKSCYFLVSSFAE